MPVNLIGSAARPSSYTNYTIMRFPDRRSLEAFAKDVLVKNPSSTVQLANDNFKQYVEGKLASSNSSNIEPYGLFGKQPRSYKEAMERNKFIYYDEYKRIKKVVEKKVAEELQKSSTAEVMKPRLVYNDKQIGEFIFDKAAMALAPELFYYSPSHGRKVDIINEKVIKDGDKLSLASDGTPVVFAFEITKGNGGIEYFEVNGEESLEEANKIGIVTCTSTNKKVFLYKEKKPKMYNAVKIVVGLTAGGFTYWKNDFYTGLTAGIVVDVLEGLGYSVDVEIVMGGGRCGACGRKLLFNGSFTHGRRFFSFTAKNFDEPMDADGLLYTLCDPSFHNIKFISLLNNFFKFYGDEIDTAGNPAMTWHGVETVDMTNPIGMYEKYIDNKKGDKNLLHFYIHQIMDEPSVVQGITDLVLTCENINLQALKKYSTHDFGTD